MITMLRRLATAAPPVRSAARPSTAVLSLLPSSRFGSVRCAAAKKLNINFERYSQVKPVLVSELGIPEAEWAPSALERERLSQLTLEVVAERVRQLKQLFPQQAAVQVLSDIPGTALSLDPEEFSSKIRALGDVLGLGVEAVAGLLAVKGPTLLSRDVTVLQSQIETLGTLLGDQRHARIIAASNPEVLSLSPEALTAKLKLVREVAAAYEPWEGELEEESPKRLGVILTRGPASLMRLKYLSELRQKRRPSMHVVTSCLKSKWAAKHPGYEEWLAQQPPLLDVQKAAKTPTKSKAAKTPTESKAAQTPTKSKAAKTPTESKAAQTPTKSKAAQTPTKSKAAQTPTESKTAQTPTESKTKATDQQATATGSAAASKEGGKGGSTKREIPGKAGIKSAASKQGGAAVRLRPPPVSRAPVPKVAAAAKGEASEEGGTAGGKAPTEGEAAVAASSTQKPAAAAEGEMQEEATKPAAAAEGEMQEEATKPAAAAEGEMQEEATKPAAAGDGAVATEAATKAAAPEEGAAGMQAAA